MGVAILLCGLDNAALKLATSEYRGQRGRARKTIGPIMSYMQSKCLFRMLA